jgi:hypothetical protein
MTKKLDKEHVDEIQTLRELFAQNASALGTIVIDKSFVDARAKKLEDEQKRLLNQFESLREQESVLMDKMRDRYGEGQINLVDGTFTPDSGLDQ